MKPSESILMSCFRSASRGAGGTLLFSTAVGGPDRRRGTVHVIKLSQQSAFGPSLEALPQAAPTATAEKYTYDQILKSSALVAAGKLWAF